MQQITTIKDESVRVTQFVFIIIVILSYGANFTFFRVHEYINTDKDHENWVDKKRKPKAQKAFIRFLHDYANYETCNKY